MKTIRSHDGTEIRYAVCGTGPVNLMFFHGWGGNRQMWTNVIPHFDGARFRSVNLDMRGHGESACSEFGYTWDSFASDALAVADQEGMVEFVPGGFSMGAKLACYLAAKYPRRIRALILVAPPALGVVPISRELGMQVCRDASDWKQIKPFFKNLWFGPSPDEELVDGCCQSISRIPRFVLEATAEMSLWTSIESSVGRLDLPALVAAGEFDPVYNPEYQQKHTLPHLEQGSSVTLAAGHFIPLECPNALAASITAFLKTIGVFA